LLTALFKPILEIDPLFDFATDKRSKVRAGFNKIDLADEQLQERVCAGDHGRPLEKPAIKVPTGDVSQVAAPSAVQLPGSRAHLGIHPGMLQRTSFCVMCKMNMGRQ
jgi:hypothetical protein